MPLSPLVIVQASAIRVPESLLKIGPCGPYSMLLGLGIYQLSDNLLLPTIDIE